MIFESVREFFLEEVEKKLEWVQMKTFSFVSSKMEVDRARAWAQKPKSLKAQKPKSPAY